jgi:hypothetical protein
MWKIEEFSDLRPIYDGQPEDDGPKPFVTLSRSQFLRLRDLAAEHGSDLALIDEGAGWVSVVLFDVGGEEAGPAAAPAYLSIARFLSQAAPTRAPNRLRKNARNSARSAGTPPCPAGATSRAVRKYGLELC